MIRVYYTREGRVKKYLQSIKETFAMITKGEPEKSFIQAGVMNNDETLTSEGEDIFLAFLLKKNGTEFKKEVVDPILAEEKD